MKAILQVIIGIIICVLYPIAVIPYAILSLWHILYWIYENKVL